MSKLNPNDIYSMMDEDYFDPELEHFEKRSKSKIGENLREDGKKDEKKSVTKFVKPIHKQYPV
jgi:hypothetical protein